MKAGHLLSDTLQKFGVTQAELSRASGIQPHRISEFRAGKHDMTVTNLQKIVISLPAPARYYFLGLLFDEKQFTESNATYN